MRVSACVIPAIAVPLLGAQAGLPAARRGSPSSAESIERLAEKVEPKVIAWRRDIHRNPELGNREFRTAAMVAEHLRSLGLEVTAKVAHTGVVGILRGGKPGGVVALRADMDALPVKEALDLPFASRVKTSYNGQEVSVMHACGHDAHTAILMGAAEVLAARRAGLKGTVKFIFQPAEDSKPDGEEGGAELMVREGVLENPKPDAIFGLHVVPLPSGVVAWRPGGIMAGVDNFRIVVRGRQTHGAMPWYGVDPVPAAAQVVLGLQTIVSRQVDLTAAPAVITVGIIRGGSQPNIVPAEVELAGTIRSFDPGMRSEIQKRVKGTAEGIARGAGAAAEVSIYGGLPVTFNDPALTARMAPVLEKAAGAGETMTATPVTAGEDFAAYQQRVPGLFFFLGVAPRNAEPGKAAMNHSPYFYVDESALVTGVRALAQLAATYLEGANPGRISPETAPFGRGSDEATR